MNKDFWETRLDVLIGGRSRLDYEYLALAEKFLMENPKIRVLSGKTEFVGTDNRSHRIAAVMNSPSALGYAHYRHSTEPTMIDQISYGIGFLIGFVCWFYLPAISFIKSLTPQKCLSGKILGFFAV